eukprot:4851214-Amphidinium_carterae.1
MAQSRNSAIGQGLRQQTPPGARQGKKAGDVPQPWHRQPRKLHHHPPPKGHCTTPIHQDETHQR